MSIDANGVVTNGMLARYDAGIKDIIAMRTAEKNPVRYKVVKSTSTGSQTYSFYKKDENDTDFVVDSASDAITVQDSIDSTSKDPVNGVAVAAEFAEQMTTQNINSIIGYTPMDSSIKGAANGVASLDGLGQVPTSQLPLADSYSPTGTKPVTGTVVAAALATLPEPMVFKGTVGTGGTITSLPAAASSNKGHTYKAISNNVISGSKIGDTFISTGSAWVTIPSGDEPSGTVTQVGINASSGSHLSASGTVTSSGNLTVGVESGYQIPTSSDVSQISTNKSNILYGLETGAANYAPLDSSSRSGSGYFLDATQSGMKVFTSGTVMHIYCEYTKTVNTQFSIQFTNDSGNVIASTSVYAPSASTSGTISSDVTLPQDVYGYNAYYNGASGNTCTITKVMICPKNVWDAIQKYVPYSTPNYDLTRLEAEDRAALAEEIDAGAKNLLNPVNVSAVTNATWDSATGTVTQTATDTKTWLDMRVKFYNNTTFVAVVPPEIVYVKQNGLWYIEFTKNSTFNILRVGHNGSAQDFNILIDVSNLENGKIYVFSCNILQCVQSSGFYSFNQLMICTKAAFGVSTKFVPYTKSNSQLTTELGSVKTVLEAIL